MFRRAIATFLLCSLIFSNFSRLYIYTAFELNQDYIAKNLCENRDKPEKHCNGKCYLSKKIKQAEEKEKKQEQEGQKKGMQEQFILLETKLATIFSLEIRKDKPIEMDTKISDRSLEILHPPPPHLS
ncbi:hypothetical protein [Pedobacter sp. GR22-6]|uniref:hypothetical protein n=1 Tax=Pedobacter sp. GR22-6 TaxID=3127957 RepID=UPI00307D3E59